MTVPRRGGIEDGEEALGSAARGRRLAVAAVLRAEVDGRVLGHPAAPQRLELGRVVVREEHVVPGEIEARRRRHRRDRDGRERAGGGRGLGNGRARTRSEEPGRQRRGVAVEDHGVGRDPLAGVEPHPRGAAALDQDLGDRGGGADRGAARLGERRDRTRQSPHAARDRPDAAALDMGDQHQRRGCRERRRPAIGRVAAEELPQPRVDEEIAEGPPQQRVGLDPQHAAEAGEAGAAHQRHRVRGAFGPDEGALQRRIDIRRLPREGLERAGRLGPREAADRVGGHLGIVDEVEPRAVRPGMAGQHGLSRERQMIVEPLARGLETVVEDIAQGEDGRAGVDQPAADLGLSQLAADGRGPLQHRHARARKRQMQGRYKAADAGADDDDVWVSHCRPILPGDPKCPIYMTLSRCQS